ncbi:unnamed protein product [Closterium sp. NIES-54]
MQPTCRSGHGGHCKGAGWRASNRRTLSLASGRRPERLDGILDAWTASCKGVRMPNWASARLPGRLDADVGVWSASWAPGRQTGDAGLVQPTTDWVG